MFGTSIKTLLVFIWFLLPISAEATEESVFRVVSANLNAEAEKAELCLKLSHPIDVSERGALASELRLEKNGKKIAVSPRDLSLTPHDICVQQLEHRQKYRLSLKKQRNIEGKQLAGGFSLSFEIPDRKKTLSTEISRLERGLPRYINASDKNTGKTEAVSASRKNAGNPLVIRAINIGKAKLTLYRFPERRLFAEAWGQAEKLRLAPSESLYFASQKGEIVWQSELVFSDKPNVEQKLDAPLPPSDELRPGLYFLAAVPDSADSSSPALMSGQWFLISNLRVYAIMAPEGLYAFVSNALGERNFSEASIQVISRDGRILSEGKASVDGKVFLALSGEQKNQAALVTAWLDTGEADIVELSRNNENEFIPVKEKAEIILDRGYYSSGMTASAILILADEKGKPQKIPASSLKLIGPQKREFVEKQIPVDQTGTVLTQISLPVTKNNGEWELLWQRNDAEILARTPVYFGSKEERPALELATVEKAISPGEELVLNVKTFSGKGLALPWRSGIMEIIPAFPEFPTWKSFLFGIEDRTGKETVKTGFVTGEKGTAIVRVKLPRSENNSPIQAVKITANLDFAVAGQSKVINVKSHDGWIGIKPREEGSFAENSVAEFEVISVDEEGKRRNAGELYYQIYEEGRSFEWFQREGKWEYTPLPQRRRIGGGRVVVPASGAARITWPVTAGHYSLEITDYDGTVLLRRSFTVGGKRQKGTQRAEGLSIVTDSGVLQKNSPKNEGIIIKLNKPALVTALIGDKKIRQTIHNYMQAGSNTITLPSMEEWGDEIKVQAHARFDDGGEADAVQTLTRKHENIEEQISVSIPRMAVGGDKLALPVYIKKPHSDSKAMIAAVFVPLKQEENSGFSSILLPATPVTKDGKAVINLNLPDFSGDMRLIVVFRDERRIVTKNISFPVRQPIELTVAPVRKVFAGEEVPFSITVSNYSAPEGKYSYDFRVPDLLHVKGKKNGTLFLKRGQNQVVSVFMEAKDGFADDLKFELKGPHGFVLAKVIPVIARAGNSILFNGQQKEIEPRQKLWLHDDENAVADDHFVLVAPFPLINLPRQLQMLLEAYPVTTEEIAYWLEASRNWSREISSMGLVGQAAFQQLRAQRIWRLELLQNPDGGFPAWPSGGDSDLAATSAALISLRREASPAAERAAAWLQRSLENTWFEESERPERAIALFALSSAGRVDISALRYFADSSREKELSPSVMATIALALSMNREEKAAEFWEQRALAALPGMADSKSAEVWPLLQVLAANRSVKTQEIINAMEKAVQFADEITPENSSIFLNAIAEISKRFGQWRLSFNGSELKTEGMFLREIKAKKPEKTELYNPYESKLYILPVRKQTEKTIANEEEDKESPVFSVQKQLYRLDGTPVSGGEKLKRGDVYLLLIKGTGELDGTKANLPLVVTTPIGSGLRIVETAAIDPGSSANSAWTWLKDGLSSLAGISLSPDEASFVLHPSREWQTACLIRADRIGKYSLPPVVVRSLSGGRISVAQDDLFMTVQQ